MTVLKTIALVFVVLVIVIVVAAVLLVRSHRKWLAQQSPIGVWQHSKPSTNILLEFQGGPEEGLYKELRETADGKIQELGHWAVNLNELRMLIVATNLPEHPRFGRDTLYRINYVGPDRIQIDGPDRPDLEFERAPDGTIVQLDELGTVDR